MRDRLQMLEVVRRKAFPAGLFWIAIYVALDYLSFVDSFRGLAITPWNPAAGLALALVLLGGVRYAPVVLVAPIIAGVLVRSASVPVPIHLVDGLLFGGSYLAAGLLARRYGRIDLRLATVRDVLTLMTSAVCAATTAALSYVTVLGLAQILADREIGEEFLRFLVGDLIGMLIVTPMVSLAFTRGLTPLMTWHAFPQLLAIVVALASIFAIPHAHEYQSFYLLFIPLLWCTFRGGVAGAAAALSVIQIGLIVALHVRQDIVGDLTSFQLLMISLAGTGLVLGSLVSQQQATAVQLRNQQLALSRALRLRSMGEMATAIAHEINQPITSIRTYAGIARDSLDDAQSERAAEAVRRIRQECDRASAIIRATRDSLRQQVLSPQVVQVDRMLEEVKELLLDRLHPDDLKLAFRIGPEAAVVTGDPVQLKQALYNIIDNSIDAIESGGMPGKVSVVAERAGPSAVDFIVTDSGPGFSRDVASISITPLISTKPDGSGIGLSIARSVAEAHGGSLVMERAKEGTIVKLRISTASQQ